MEIRVNRFQTLYMLNMKTVEVQLAAKDKVIQSIRQIDIKLLKEAITEMQRLLELNLKFKKKDNNV
jgi:hypothetical protein